jgi:heptosyltransferase-2
MSFALDLVLKVFHVVSDLISLNKNKKVKSILVLRNNGVGDLICITPLFKMLNIEFPDAKITVGIGDWHEDILGGNPYIEGVIRINAPWHNQFVSPLTKRHALSYLLASDEVRKLNKQSFDVGLDIVGSKWGSLLFLRCGIPKRIGVKGYAGGHTACHASINFDANCHITKAALKMGMKLGCKKLSDPKPQIFLTQNECRDSELKWKTKPNHGRLVIAPEGSFEEKCWGKQNFNELIKLILEKTNFHIIKIGSEPEHTITYTPRTQEGNICHYQNLSGALNLRQSSGIVATCDVVICNSSVAMHMAGAFAKPCIVLLGKWYDSAELHATQWGHEDSTVLGRELNKCIEISPSPEIVFNKLVQIFRLKSEIDICK